jgi:hypothetical protein
MNELDELFNEAQLAYQVEQDRKPISPLPAVRPRKTLQWNRGRVILLYQSDACLGLFQEWCAGTARRWARVEDRLAKSEGEVRL